MPSKTVTVIGSLNADLVTTTPRMPSAGETLTASSFTTGPGGKGANQAVACARLSRPNPIAPPGPPRTPSISVPPTSAVSPPSSNPLPVPSRPSITVRMVGALGEDALAQPLLQSLHSCSIDCSSVSWIPDQPTGTAVIIVESSTGENRILITPGANSTLQPTQFTSPSSFLPIFTTADNPKPPNPDLVILQLEIPLPTVLQILLTAHSAGIPTLLNPAPAVELPDKIWPLVTHLILNESEAALLSGKNPEDFADTGNVNWQSVSDGFVKKGVKFVVVTLGSKGAWWSDGVGKGGLVPAEKVEKVVDTTAAGDTFVGGYAVGVVGGIDGMGGMEGDEKEEGRWDMVAVVRWACKAAGRTVEKRGAQSAIPWADEVDVAASS